ncbi:hypothetical protein BFW88_08940 [Pseudomonas fluorescens]|nr:hypothetical protein BFW88_08940 [Pseudomonas fluorescens]OPB13174.1 hypothetical protein BFW92_08915 [Pseudomonas fluorescens]OPB24279.1 hypothetical protein BFW93_08950 [Pseudomonas fluorescens]
MNAHPAPADQRVLSQAYLQKVFADRPRLEDVANALLQQGLNQRFASQALRAANLAIGQPIKDSTGGYTQIRSAADALIKRVMRGEAVHYAPDRHVVLNVSGTIPKALSSAMTINDLAQLINQTGPLLVARFQQRLADYWSEPATLVDPLSSRWRSVSKHLNLCLKKAPQVPPLSIEHSRRVLGDLYPTREERDTAAGPDQYPVFLIHAVSGPGPGEWLTLLLLKRRWQGREAYYLYSPDGSLLSLDSLNNVAPLLPRYMSDHRSGEGIRWAVFEPDGDVFDRLAQTLLEKQLRDVAQISWSSFPSVGYYKQLFNTLTAPDAWFSPPDSPHAELDESRLPAWLQGARPELRRIYSQWLDKLAEVERASAGADYLDGVDTISVYTRKALQKQMARDYPQEVAINPDDYAVAITRTQGGTVGWTHITERSLTEWALDNPFTSSYAHAEIKNLKEPGYVPDWWLTTDYLKTLIEQVDIGQHYPAFLEQTLTGDSTDVRRRQQLFHDHARVQLPLLALEHLLRGRAGFTWESFKTLRALLDPQTAAQRVSDHRPVVARPLAFLLHAGARARVAANMFLIGAANAANSPHILYRPGGPQILQAFASRQGVLDAIAQTGTPLNIAVLNSLDEPSRVLFGNGGFLSPHTQRQLQGDEHSPSTASSPALLSDEQVAGDFLQHVFKENAKALVAKARQQAVSTQAQRWAAFRNDLWQVFNTVLPLLRGPLATTGWLVQLMRSTQALVSGQAQDAAATSAEFISSLAGLLLHHVATLDERLGIAPAKPHRVSAEIGAVPAHNTLQLEGSALMRAVPPKEISPICTPSWSSATATLSKSQRENLATFRWRAENAMAFQRNPVQPAFVETKGPTKGLYRVFTREQRYYLHAHIDKELYPVTAVEDGFRVIDIHQHARLGPWVKSDGNGVWSFDLRLRLLGGMRRSRQLPSRADIQRRNQMLDQDYQRARAELVQSERSLEAAFKVYSAIRDNPEHPRFGYGFQRYEQAQQEQERCQVTLLEALKRKHENQPINQFNTELIEQLDDMVSNLRQQIALQVIARNAARASKEVFEGWINDLAATDDAIVLPSHQAIFEHTNTAARFNRQLLELSLKEQARLHERSSIPSYDPAAYPPDEMAKMIGTPMNWRTKLIENYQILMLKRPPIGAEYENYDPLSKTLDLLIREVLTHGNLLAADELPRDKRIELLGEVIKQYTAIQDRLDFVGAPSSDLFDLNVFEQLERLITDVREEAEQAQAQLLKEQAQEPTAKAPTRRPSGSRQRLIVTRNKQVFRGQVRERTPEQDADIVDVEEPIDHQRLGTFKASEETGVWEEICAQAPRPHAPARSVKSLMGDADILLERARDAINEAGRIALASNSPITVEEELTRIAANAREKASKLRQAIDQRGKPASAREASQLNDLETTATALTEEGRLLRIEIIKRNPPQASRIQYLKEQGEIEIVKIEGRVKLRRDGDYLQEYLIRDNDRTPLAYAHFHYRTEQAPLAEFTAGHLKRTDQRYVGFVSTEGQPAQNLLQVHRSVIGSRLAEALFFGVTRTVPRTGRGKYW